MGGGAPVSQQNSPPQGDNLNETSKSGKKSSNASPNKDGAKNRKGKTKNKQYELAPKCQHKTPSEFVCLNEKCKTYPFYSSNCDKNCYNKHIHSTKVTSIRVKQLQNKIQNCPQVSSLLLDQVQSYKQTLTKLRVVIQDFITAELQGLQNLQKSKSEQLSQEALQLKNKIQNQKFAGITGTLLSKLWSNVKFQEEDQQLQQSKYIKEKMKNVEELGKCFKEILSNFEEQSEEQQQVEQQKLEKKKGDKLYHMFKRYKLYDDMSLGKEGSWNSTLQP